MRNPARQHDRGNPWPRGLTRLCGDLPGSVHAISPAGFPRGLQTRSDSDASGFQIGGSACHALDPSTRRS
jgi:hypothetical protein